MDASEHRNLAPDLPAGLKRKLGSLAHGALRALQVRAERSGLIGKLEVPEPELLLDAKPWVHADAKVKPEPYLAAAERIAEGWLDVFALRDVDLGQPPRWNRDPKTGIEAPLAHGKSLDCANPDLVGDIHYLWQPNRHRHLVTLAQAYAISGKRKYFIALAEQLESWFIACPHRKGPNWASALEASLRLANWSIAWQLVGGADCKMFQEPHYAEFRGRWLHSVYQHAEFIRGWLSFHAEGGALIGEAAGLYLAGTTWPHWARSADWAEAGRSLLEREALAQTGADGVHRSQALGRQQLVIELELVCLLAARANGRPFSDAYASRLEAMLDYVASIMDAGGNVPQFGDRDDSSVTRLAVEEGCAYRSLLATGAILFRRGDFKVKARRLDDATRWRLGARADAQFDELDLQKTRLPARQTFPDGGYYVLGCDFETPREIRVVADAGPLGERPAAAHGHADALSFTLSAAGLEFLVDPGTYAYHSRERWRQYLRGTSAHNTVCIDGADHAPHTSAGCSLWLSSAQKDCFEGWHDGYLGLGDPVKHRRLIELDKGARRIALEDTLEMAEDHEVELFFHCHEAAVVEEAPGGFVIRRGEASIRLALPRVEGARSAVYRGSLTPMAGWVSRSFDSREPASTIVWAARLSGPQVLRTEITVSA